MIALLSLAVLIGYVAIAIFVTWAIARRFATAKAKSIVAILLVLFFVAVPTADHAIGYMVFKHYCETEAGTKIYRTVENVEGFRDDVGSIGYITEYGGKQHLGGYQFIEKKKSGKDLRYVQVNDKVIEEINVLPKSLYRFTRDRKELSAQLAKVTNRIESIQSSQLLAQRTVLYFRGGWVQRELSKIGGLPTRCPESSEDTSDNIFVSKVLIPIRTR